MVCCKSPEAENDQKTKNVGRITTLERRVAGQEIEVKVASTHLAQPKKAGRLTTLENSLKAFEQPSNSTLPIHVSVTLNAEGGSSGRVLERTERSLNMPSYREMQRIR